MNGNVGVSIILSILLGVGLVRLKALLKRMV